MHSKKLRLPTGWLHYLDGGDSHNDAPPVLFLHGWALSSSLFSDSLERLSMHRRVIGLDWPGFNRSSGSVVNWQYEDYASVIETFVDELGLAQYHVAGHSTGGAIAAVLATRRPAQVRSLILIDSAGIRLESFWRVFRRKAMEIPAQFVAKPHIRIHSKIIFSALFNFVFRATNTYHCMKLPLYHDLSEHLSQISIPSLVIWGENDGMVPLVIGKQLAEKIPGASLLVLPDAYHEWSALKPELFAQVVERFVAQH